MEHRNQPDWWGRVLGLLGLLAGIGAVGYVYYQGRETAPLDQQLIRRFSEELERQSQEIAGNLTEQSRKFNNEWDAQLTGAITQFQQDARGAVEQEQRAQSQRADEFARALSARKTALASLLEGGLETWQAKLATPRLRVSTVAYRPNGGDEAAVVVIKNDGSNEALVRRISFRPQSEFAVSAPDQPRKSSVDFPFEMLTIEFDASHNQSTQTGRHGLYIREYDEPVVVPGHGYLALKIVIGNDAHVGWGLEGQATIDYDAQESLEIPAARAYFVPLAAS